MLTSSTLHLPGQESLDHEGDESEDEMDDDVPWRSPSEKIAYVYFCLFVVFYYNKLLRRIHEDIMTAVFDNYATRRIVR